MSTRTDILEKGLIEKECLEHLLRAEKEIEAAEEAASKWRATWVRRYFISKQNRMKDASKDANAAYALVHKLVLRFAVLKKKLGEVTQQMEQAYEQIYSREEK